jgi:hypothetical protein
MGKTTLAYELLRIGKRKCCYCKRILDLNETNFCKRKSKLGFSSINSKTTCRKCQKSLTREIEFCRCWTDTHRIGAFLRRKTPGWHREDFMKLIRKIIYMLLGRCKYCGGEILWWDDGKGSCFKCGKDIN